jgi:tRNA(Ile)-lysidine synthase
VSVTSPKPPRGLSAAHPNPRDDLLERSAARLLSRWALLPETGGLLAAVSGGPDSMALLHFLLAHFARTGRPPGGIAVAHVNHGLRGAESDSDAAFVADLARGWGLRCEVARVDPAARRRERGETLEQAARALRYGALRDLAARLGADRVAVAHTADDQGETVLFRMIRGAGLRGLAGMRPRGRVEGIRVIRPLLEASREQVFEYLARHGVAYRVDPSNAEPSASRNFLRHEILPRIQERLNPAVRRALVREADAFREADAYLRREARRVLPDVIATRAPDKIGLDAARMLAYPNVLRKYLFRCVIQELNGDLRDLSTVHIEALLSLLTSRPGRSADLPMGLRAQREHGEVVLARRGGEPVRAGGPSNA